MQHREIATRDKLLGDWQRLKRLHVPDADIARVTGISRADPLSPQTCPCYLRHTGPGTALPTPEAGPPERRTPGCTRPGHAPRRQHPSYGKAKLTVLLARDHGIPLSESTVGRILTDLMRRGLVVRYADATRIVRKRKFTGHVRRWAYNLRPTAPGEMLQIDHMTVNKHTYRLKHFQAWDPVTKYTHAEVYSDATSANAARFLDGLQQALPFPVSSIQVDGGSEFMKDFEAACQAKGIPLYVLPPKRPQYNGGVERMNRTMRDDLYARKDLLANDMADFRDAVRKATHTYNHYRPHQSLDNLTPAQYFAQLQAADQSQML